MLGYFCLPSLQFSRSVVSDSLRPHESQHARPPCPSPTPGAYPNPCPLSQWCHPTISSSVVLFSSCPQSFPASGSFQMSQLFAWGGQSIGVSASTSVLPMNTQDWSSFGWTGWISLQSKGLSRVFSNTTVKKQQFLRSPKFNLSYHPTQLVYWQVLSTQLPRCYLQSIHFFPSPPSPVPGQTTDLLSLNKTLNGSPHIKHNPFPTHYPKWTEESLWKEMQGMLLFCLKSINSFTIRIG